jgi:hypothetical protein
MRLLHELRLAMPRENSITGFRAALARYQKDYLCSPQLWELDVSMLSRAYEQYAKFLAAVRSEVDFVPDTETVVKGPFAACPMCHKECSGGTIVCTSSASSALACTRNLVRDALPLVRLVHHAMLSGMRACWDVVM